MNIREKVWVIENRIVNARYDFWKKIEEIGANRQEEILKKHIIWSKEQEPETIRMKFEEKQKFGVKGA